MAPNEDQNPTCSPNFGTHQHEKCTSSLSSISFDRSQLKLFEDGECLTIYDYNLDNSMLFSQGDWSMIRRDLELAGVGEDHINALEMGPCRELIRAYRVRRELINYKKLCLHLFEDAQKIERELKQSMSFFFWNDGDKRLDGIKAHMEAIHSLMSYDLNDDISPMEVDHVKLAIKRHDIGSCSLLDRKILYTLACGAWMHHVGIKKALHDARDLAKAICMSPRHPDGQADGERPAKLENLPYSMQIYTSLLDASTDGSRKSKNTRTLNSKEIQGSGTNSDGNKETSGARSMSFVLEAVQKSLKWPKEGINFLRHSIIARGGFKALAIVEELNLYYLHLSKLQDDIQDSLEGCIGIHLKSVSNMSCTNTSKCGYEEDMLGKAVLRLNNIHFLRGALKACTENLKWIHEIKSFGLDCESVLVSNHSRLFVAGDSAHSNSACAFVPKGFELGSFATISRNVLDVILIPCMKASIKIESWPPQEGSNRTRVVGFKGELGSSGKLVLSKINNKKISHCLECDGYFHNNWIRHNICSICDLKRRENHDGKYCSFQDCKGGKMNPFAYCPHLKQCFYCDSPHSCEKFCRLSRGNGELALELVEATQPKLLLLDFDRTFCSTKAGASPMNQRNKSTDSVTHSLDQDLSASIKSLRDGIAHIVTRNSHKEDIQTFLSLNGFSDLPVHIVPKKICKGNFIKNTFFKENTNKSCIFIDDDLRELIRDPWMCQQENIHRLHFVRAFL